METRETDILEPFWEDLFDRFWNLQRSGWPTEAEGQMQAGFRCHAAPSSAQIARWVFRLKTDAPPGLEDPQASGLFFFGTGYVFGLKAAKRISVRQQAALLERLHTEVGLSKLQPPKPDVPKAAALDLLSLLFSSDPAEPRYIRSRALLIQILRQKACPAWIAIRQALYDPEKIDVASLQAILQTTHTFVSKEDLAQIAAAIES